MRAVLAWKVARVKNGPEIGSWSDLADGPESGLEIGLGSDVETYLENLLEIGLGSASPVDVRRRHPMLPEALSSFACRSGMVDGLEVAWRMTWSLVWSVARKDA